MAEFQTDSVSTALTARIVEDIAAHGGWISFERFMQAALYTPGLGYYARGTLPFGHLPSGGSDFVTAPELSPLFGRCLAVQVEEALSACQAHEVIEFGAGSGALAEQLLRALDSSVQRYTIVEVSAGLQQRQRERLAPWGSRIRWVSQWPSDIHGVVVGNEVLDAMPATLLTFDGEQWLERGVAVHEGVLVFADRPTPLRPPVDGPWPAGTVTEIQPQAQAFMTGLAQRLTRGMALLIDYGFPEAEYYHPQRSSGTLMCHRAHQSDGDPLRDVGLKDITVHVDFTAMALAAQDAGADVLGYTSQANFLLNCGLDRELAQADAIQRSRAQLLMAEHEMGELFKVLAIGRGLHLDPLGFVRGDRMHRL
ncbi:MAG: hypothetical protein RI949_1872 [Pseudomonadota bacterium]